jgi:hypothetical protein
MQPLGFFTGYDPITSTPTALHILDKKFGSYLQRLTRIEKLALLAVISHCLAANAHPDTEDFIFTLEEAWAELGYELPVELGGMLPSLNELGEGDLLGKLTRI